ncbi:MAG: galactose-1-phosphate uridylyltransferase [Deltaproteobacteria bacterium RIFCSPLOWO2_02_FULL_53_8]|nr:MAG: galactose-1-phosphate uridylyltransferase [Deltaproteobacteria bacterium RIFCSPLOWO2_02_FULL_53_8]
MSEMRLNLITRDWVVIASERAKRPEEFTNSRPERPVPPAYLHSCPFCVGNERKTSEDRFRLSDGDGWRIRVVANRYPAVSLSGEKVRRADVLMRSVSGVGIHEVIVEHPVHNVNMAHFEGKHLEDVIRVYKERFVAANLDPRVEHVIIFKNYGAGAGTAVDHPHAQLIATPVVPYQFRDRVRAAMHFFDDTGECLHCAMLRRELAEGARIITDTGHFTTFIPYAALSPFHTWIFPKRHSASFSDMAEAETGELAYHLKTLLAKFYYGLENPDFNFVIRSSRPQDARNEYCHWYMSVVPKLSTTAGFELGSSMYVNIVPPEDCAAFMRSARTE